MIPVNGTSVATGYYVNLYDDNDQQTFDKVIMYYNDTDGFESGTGTNEFVDNNLWATQAIADHVLSVLTGYTHKPYTGTRVYVDPAIELGDTVTLGGVDYVLFNATITYGGNVVMDIGAPGETELNHEYPYVGSYSKAIKNKVTLGAAYYGTTITREDGLKITRSDGVSETTINSDKWEVLVNGVRKLYADYTNDKLVFDGTLSADVIQALGAVLTPFLYAGKANIAELTVDEMNTGDKVAKYLASNTDDVNYIKIDDQYVEFITASTDGASTEQVKNRDGNNLYWMDDTHVAVTTDTTAYPVTIYVYTETVKAAINFELDDDGETYVPKIIMGAGDGVTDKSGKGYIYKNTEGLIMEYYSQNDELLRRIGLTDAGITITPKIFSIESVSNSTAVAATTEVTLDGFDIDFTEDTKVAFTAHMDITPSVTMDLTVKVRVDSIVQKQTVFHFANTSKDGRTFSGEIEGIEEGTKTVDITITPSTGTANISSGGYQLTLTVLGIVAAAAPPSNDPTKGYAIGGTTNIPSFARLTDNDEYEPIGDVWTGKANMVSPARRFFRASAVLGKAYAYGGDSGSYLSDCDEYDPVGNSWASKANMPFTNYYMAASTLLERGYVYAGYAGAKSTVCWEYEPLTNIWSTKTSMPSPARYQHDGCTISDKGYVFSGNDGSVTPETDEYDSVGDSWAGKADIISPSRFQHGAFNIGAKGYVVGGYGGATLVDNDEYDPVGNSWAVKTNTPTPGRRFMGPASILGKGYIFGGDAGNPRYDDNDEYDQETDVWISKVSLPSPVRDALASTGI